MATRAEIINNIENTRENILHTVDEISGTIHRKINVQEQIKSNPYAAIAIAAALGFSLAALSTPIGKYLFRFAFRSATAAAGAYFSKKGLDYVSGRIRQS